MEKKQRAFIIAGLRKTWLTSKKRYSFIKNGRVARGKYKCVNCDCLFKLKEVDVHHLKPVSVMEVWNWDEYINNLFLGECVLLCKSCHKQETKKEKSLKKK